MSTQNPLSVKAIIVGAAIATLGSAAGALAGGYLALVKRLRHPVEDLPPELTTDSFLSRLTYGAMAVWGVGETFDSIPSLMGLFGLRFMVYSGGVWFLALLVAVGSSIVLICQGTPAHRRRVVMWYGLLVVVGVSASIGLVPRVAVPVVAAAMPIVWLVRTRKHRRAHVTTDPERLARSEP